MTLESTECWLDRHTKATTSEGVCSADKSYADGHCHHIASVSSQPPYSAAADASRVIQRSMLRPAILLALSNVQVCQGIHYGAQEL